MPPMSTGPQSVWNGMGVPPQNCVSTDFFVESTLRVTLDLAQVVTIVQLSSTTHAVNLFTTNATIWYRINGAPGPIPQPSTGTFVDVIAFRPGGILQPDRWQQVVMPIATGTPPQLYLVSQSDYPTLDIVMLEETW